MSAATSATASKVRLERIQKALGIQADGLLGPETLTALESRLGIAVDRGTVSLECSRASIDAIVGFEVSSRAWYEKSLQKPTWPGGSSGVTIGIGYDLGYSTRARIEADWNRFLDDGVLEQLLVAQGIKGENARQLVRALGKIRVPYEPACAVFLQSSLPRYAALVRGIYPGVQNLPADAQGMLLSLVYNRGASLTGPARREMAALAPLVKGGVKNLERMAAQFESMRRLWPGVAGLVRRREREARMIRASRRVYTPDELIRI